MLEARIEDCVEAQIQLPVRLEAETTIANPGS
jgi:hypothetical protein